MPHAFRGCDCRRPDTGERRHPHNYLVVDGAIVWACRACMGIWVPAWMVG